MNLKAEKPTEYLDSKPILVETALLGQGMPSLSNAEIAARWPTGGHIKLVWLQAGKVKIGGIAEFLSHRQASSNWQRGDSRNIKAMIKADSSAYLTVSALLTQNDDQNNRGLIVTAGLGGVRGKTVSADLTAMRPGQSIVFATAFKDVLDYEATFRYIKENQIQVSGWAENYCDGFLFSHGKKYPLDSINEATLALKFQSGQQEIILHPLPQEKRLSNGAILEQARRAGEEAENNGKPFHPAANKVLDELTAGKASTMQLEALLNNIALAARWLQQSG